MYRNKNHSYSVVSFVIAIIFVICICVGLCIVNSTSKFEKTSLNKEEFLEELNNAEEIHIMKNYMSLANAYHIIVDGKIIGSVSGEVFYVLGDCFSMRSSNGDLISYEKEEVFHLNNQASIRNEEDIETGRIESKILTLLYECSYLDVEGNTLATSEQHFSLLRKDTIKDANGNVVYRINDTNYFASNLIIEVLDNSTVSPEIAIFIATIDEAIDSSSD